VIRAGELLSVIIDEKMLGKAKEYSRLFDAWAELTGKYGIAAAADHSRINDIRRNVIFVEADHPGWIQILQTREHRLLEDLQAAFPELGISGIAFKLQKAPAGAAPTTSKTEGPAAEADTASGAGAAEENAAESEAAPDQERENEDTDAVLRAYDKIKNRDLREKLKSLEQSISQKAKTRNAVRG
jgi:hypothetical protein